jgi:ABC-type glycerol-3-phosphate transport system substrate-binding protein
MKMFRAFLKVVLAALVLGAVMAFLTGFKFETVDYTVVAGDTLQSIAEKFIVRNTGTVRGIKEFEEGIRDENYEVIGDGGVLPGEILKINYWEAD